MAIAKNYVNRFRRDFNGTGYVDSSTGHVIIVQAGDDLQDAIDRAGKIASATKRIGVMVTEGVYDGRITLRPYVDLYGTSRTGCVLQILYDGTNPDQYTVFPSDNCSIRNFTIRGTRAPISASNRHTCSDMIGWTVDQDVTGTNPVVDGHKCMQLQIGAALAAGDTIATWHHGRITNNVWPSICLWMRSSAPVAANTYKILLDSGANGIIPAMDADKWYQVQVPTQGAVGTSLSIVALDDPGATTIYISDIRYGIAGQVCGGIQISSDVCERGENIIIEDCDIEGDDDIIVVADGTYPGQFGGCRLRNLRCMARGDGLRFVGGYWEVENVHITTDFDIEKNSGQWNRSGPFYSGNQTYRNVTVEYRYPAGTLMPVMPGADTTKPCAFFAVAGDETGITRFENCNAIMICDEPLQTIPLFGWTLSPAQVYLINCVADITNQGENPVAHLSDPSEEQASGQTYLCNFMTNGAMAHNAISSAISINGEYLNMLTGARTAVDIR